MNLKILFGVVCFIAVIGFLGYVAEENEKHGAPEKQSQFLPLTRLYRTESGWIVKSNFEPVVGRKAMWAARALRSDDKNERLVFLEGVCPAGMVKIPQVGETIKVSMIDTLAASMPAFATYEGSKSYEFPMYFVTDSCL